MNNIQRDRNRNQFNPLLRLGSVINNEIQIDDVREFIKTIINKSKSEGIDESIVLSNVKEYFHSLTDSVLTVIAEYYNRPNENIIIYEKEDKLLTVSEVAKIMGFTSQYVRTLIKEGEIASVNYGERKTKIKESDLKIYLERKKNIK
jgi:excisionase family DNA binding protein